MPTSRATQFWSVLLFVFAAGFNTTCDDDDATCTDDDDATCTDDDDVLVYDDDDEDDNTGPTPVTFQMTIEYLTDENEIGTCLSFSGRDYGIRPYVKNENLMSEPDCVLGVLSVNGKAGWWAGTAHTVTVAGSAVATDATKVSGFIEEGATILVIDDTFHEISINRVGPISLDAAFKFTPPEDTTSDAGRGDFPDGDEP